MKEIDYKWIRITDSITWLYCNGIIEHEERDRLLKKSEAMLNLKAKDAQKTNNKGCGKQCLVDGELHIMCGDFIKEVGGEIFLCHNCSSNLKAKDVQEVNNG